MGVSRWTAQRLCGFDIETTGTNPTEARIVTASGIDSRTNTIHEWLADPGIEIPAEATAIHGITTEFARQHGWRAAAVAVDITEWLYRIWGTGSPIVIYNAPYDLTVLDCELARHSDAVLVDYGPIGPIIDPLVIDKYVDKYRKGSRKLSAVCAHYGVTITDEHTSSGDASATARLARAIVDRYPEIGGIPLIELQDIQAKAYREQQLSFASCLRIKALTGHPDDRASALDRAEAVAANADNWPYLANLGVAGRE